jgi:hypothetical protein
MSQITAVERSPEKAGGGGSIPSLATTKSVTYKPSKHAVLSETCQKTDGTGSSWGVRSSVSSDLRTFHRPQDQVGNIRDRVFVLLLL